MNDRIESLLEQILAELKTMNERAEQAVEENKKQRATADNALGDLMGMVQKTFNGGHNGR